MSIFILSIATTVTTSTNFLKNNLIKLTKKIVYKCYINELVDCTPLALDLLGFHPLTRLSREEYLLQKFPELVWAVDNDLTKLNAKSLIENGADVNYKIHGYGNTLSFLIQCGNINLDLINKIKLLLDNGSNVNICDNLEQTPLIYLIFRIIRLIFCNDNEFDDIYNLLDLLINSGANVNAIDAFGNTPLILFAKLLNSECPTQRVSIIIEHLIKSGAAVNWRSDNNSTALSYACKNLNVSLIKILLNNGSDVNIKDNNGYTPLMHYISNVPENILAGDVDFFVNFIRLTADTLHLKNNNEETCYDIYSNRKLDILDNEQLDMLNGNFRRIKSARM